MGGGDSGDIFWFLLISEMKWSLFGDLRRNWPYWVCLIGYFWSLAADGVWSRFAADDPGNMAGYQARGLWNVAVDNVEFFTSSYRPFGGLFYLSVYKLAHLNPIPYRVIILIILTGNLVIAYYWVLLVTEKRQIAMLATFLSAYHVNLLALYYYTSFIYDILCFTFYFLAFTHYLKCRRNETPFTVKELSVLAVLYICALNAKEMAFTLPGLVIAYEAANLRPGHLRQIVRKCWMPIGLLIVVSIADIPAKIWGPHALAANSSYQLVPTFTGILNANASYIENIFYRPLESLRWQHTIWIWSLTLLLAVISRQRHLLFSWCCVTLIGTPTALIGRGGGPGLYIPLLAWSLFISSIIIGAGGMIGERRILRRLYWAGVFVLVGFVAWYTHRTKWTQMPAVYSGQVATWAAIEALRTLNIEIPKGGKVLFLDDPFDDWDMVFIARLWFRDPTLEVDLAKRTTRPAPVSELGKYDRVLKFEGKTLIVVTGR